MKTIRRWQPRYVAEFDPMKPDDCHIFTLNMDGRVRMPIHLIECAVCVFKKMQWVIWPPTAGSDQLQCVNAEISDRELKSIFTAALANDLIPTDKNEGHADERMHIYMFEPKYTAPGREHTAGPYIRIAARLHLYYDDQKDRT